MKKLLLSITVILLCSVSLAGCTGINKGSDVKSNNDSTVEADFDITASHLEFSPNIIEVNAGETITVRITSQDEMHDFVIDELDIDSGFIGGGDSAVVQITIPADASGEEYEFYCSVSNHRALGMVGTLKVL